MAVGLLSACQAKPTELPNTPTLPPTLTHTPTASPAPTLTSTPTPTLTPYPISLEYNQKLLSALPSSGDSCLPDQMDDDVGIYVYDLSQGRELVSINADTPFQFASAFKGPAFAYFLSQCRQYWDPTAPEWDAYFHDQAAARDIPYYVSPEYRAIVAPYLKNAQNWENIEAFFDANRVVNNGAAGVVDKRYFILSKAYSMTTRSNNPATGEILQFVYDHCAAPELAQPAPACYEDNAISRFNAWFNEFAGITYHENEARRGLYKWDTVIEKDKNGAPYEADMVTKGQEDRCVTQTARLNCSNTTGSNVWTARDFFKFYSALYDWEDARAREMALSMLAIDNDGPARGLLKNLARNMGAVSMSKNGHAHFILGSINTEAGILDYQNTPFIVVVMGYDAQPSLSLLYGDYDSKGEPATDVSLLRDLLNQYLETP
ncbi:MAG: hypothetical protein IT310_04785 [Anaerolineales bacterium]|nr:hypothetical protein [Anaerolineales bacterium]